MKWAQVIGVSDFKYGDPDGLWRMGRFTPGLGYDELAPLYQELSLSWMELLDINRQVTAWATVWAPHDYQAQVERLEARGLELESRCKELEAKASAIPLRVQAPSGETVPIRSIRIEDHAGKDVGPRREVTIHVDGLDAYERFFGPTPDRLTSWILRRYS